MSRSLRQRDVLTAAAVVCALLVAAGAYCQQTERQYLSGTDKDHTVPWKFKCTSGARAGRWTTLPVPSHWDMHGFGSLNYYKDPKSAWDETGLYEYSFRVPEDWADKRVFLVFEGVMTDTTVTLNGKSAGPTHQGGFYRFQYEVTDLVKFDKPNRLEVTVAKHSANESVNRAEREADYWLFGGIYRPVYLEAVPKGFIKRVAIDAHADGSFTMDVYVDGADETHLIDAQIMDLDGQPVGKLFKGKNANTPTTLTAKIDSPRQWSAETPNLYQVEVRLKRDKEVVHRYTQRFGFRTMEVREGDGLYVNGRRVVLKGVNRHSSWPDSGRCLSKEVHRLDIETMKDMNMNAVRMSHYPPDPEFLDLCDELGLYVLDELAGWHAYYDTPTGRRLVESLVARDVNHPCILFWDNGNEGGFNRELDEVFVKFDPQKRPVLHPWEEFQGVNTAHYLEYDRAKVASQGAPTRHGTGKKYEEWEDMDAPQTAIYMPTEMLHGLYDGGAGAGFEDYWQMMSAGARQPGLPGAGSPLLGGGFFWVFADEGIKRPGTDRIDCAGNSAPDGIVGPYREREGSFYTIKELWSPIVVTREDDGTFTVENHYSFTDATQCKFTWQLRRFPRPDETGAGFAVAKKSDEGTIAVPSIPPGGSGKLPLKLPRAESPADALAIRVDDPDGRELWTWVWPMRDLQIPLTPPEEQSGPPVVSTRSADAIIVIAGELAIRFSTKTGLLESVRRGAQTYSLTNGPRPAVGDFTLKDLWTATDDADDAVVVGADYDGDLQEVTWVVSRNGWVKCQYRYQADGPLEFYGVTFDYPENLVRSKRWLGDGPFRVWKNRLRGVTLGVWQNDYNNTITGYSGWEYPEFKGCFADVYWMQLETDEGPITIVPGDQDVFVQVLTPDLPPDNLVGKTKLTLPDAGLAILHAIPPVGSKFKDVTTTGPQGQPNMAEGSYTGSVSFYFGELP